MPGDDRLAAIRRGADGLADTAVAADDDMVILASESGTLPIPEENIVQKWRLQPGKMLLIDTEQGRIISDDEIPISWTLALLLSSL